MTKKPNGTRYIVPIDTDKDEKEKRQLVSSQIEQFSIVLINFLLCRLFHGCYDTP